MEKYELIKEGKTTFMGRVIYRIRALKDFGDVKAGDIGGWVCSYNNLSQEGDCWIYDKAKCLDKARILDNAKMFDNAIMYDNAKMYGNARMYNEAKMFDNAEMYDNSRMYDNTRMFDNAKMYDNAEMYGNAKIYGNAIMYDSSVMYDSTRMLDNAIIYGNAKMYDNSRMSGNAKMYDNAEIYDKVILDKDKLLYGSINKSYKKIFQHYRENKLITAILTEENEILYSIGSQIGITKEKLINIIYNYCRVIDKELEEYSCRQEYLKIIDMAENHLRKFI